MSELSEYLGDEKIRFHVIDAEDRQRSSDWIVWESKESVYLSTTSLSGVLKLSIHPRGVAMDGFDTQFGTTAGFWQKLIKRSFSGNAPFHRWKRPDPSEKQVCMIASISFPTAFLRNVVAKKKLGGRKLAFPLPVEGKAFELCLLNHRLDPNEIEDALISKLYTPMICIKLDCGENISIVGRYAEFPMSADELFDVDKARSNWIGESVLVGDSIDDAHAIMIQNYPKDGHPLHLAEINGFTITRNA